MAPESAECARQGTPAFATDLQDSVTGRNEADTAAGEANFRFTASTDLFLVDDDACRSAHFIQHRSTTATQADIGGKRWSMMSSSRLQAPDGTVCFGKTLNLETMCRIPINITIVWLSGCILSCTKVLLAQANTATRPPILINKGNRTELFGASL